MNSPIQNPKSKIQNPVISLIVAMSRNRVIGRNHQLPWHMPADLKHFKALTTDHAVIMGRRTFESINRKPLPGRTNVIVTRDRLARFDGAIAAPDLDHAVALAAEHDRRLHRQNEIFVLGGSEVFREALPRAQRIYLTLIDAAFEGDTLFPEVDRTEWKIVADEAHRPDENNAHPYRFQLLENLNPPACTA